MRCRKQVLSLQHSHSICWHFYIRNDHCSFYGELKMRYLSIVSLFLLLPSNRLLITPLRTHCDLFACVDSQGDIQITLFHKGSSFGDCLVKSSYALHYDEAQIMSQRSPVMTLIVTEIWRLLMKCHPERWSQYDVILLSLGESSQNNYNCDYTAQSPICGYTSITR